MPAKNRDCRAEAVRRILREGPSTFPEMVATLNLPKESVRITVKGLWRWSHIRRIGAMPNRTRDNIYELTERGKAWSREISRG